MKILFSQWPFKVGHVVAPSLGKDILNSTQNVALSVLVSKHREIRQSSPLLVVQDFYSLRSCRSPDFFNICIEIFNFE